MSRHSQGNPHNAVAGAPVCPCPSLDLAAQVEVLRAVVLLHQSGSIVTTADIVLFTGFGADSVLAQLKFFGSLELVHLDESNMTWSSSEVARRFEIDHAYEDPSAWLHLTESFRSTPDFERCSKTGRAGSLAEWYGVVGLLRDPHGSLDEIEMLTGPVS